MVRHGHNHATALVNFRYSRYELNFMIPLGHRQNFTTDRLLTPAHSTAPGTRSRLLCWCTQRSLGEIPSEVDPDEIGCRCHSSEMVC